MAKIIIVVLIWVLIACSWVTNAYKLVTSDFEAPYKTEVIRGIGIPFAPLGVITGFMDIGEENK